MPDPLQSLFAAARAIAALHHPHYATRIVVFLEDGRKAYDGAVPDCPGGAAGPQLNEMERDVLEALGDSTMTGEQIAAASGYPDNSGLRSCLASLRRRGVLTGRQGEPGYSAARPSP